MNNREKADLADIENSVIAHDCSAKTRPTNESFSLCCCCDENQNNLGMRRFIVKEIDENQKVLILDLDETLVHCSFYPPPYYDEIITIKVDQASYQVYVQKRPYLEEFITEVLKDFYVIIFTASVRSYANPIIDKVIPQIPPNQRLFRESCTYMNGMYVKNLDKFYIPLKNIVIVDNNPCSFSLHEENGVLSTTWMGEKEDTDLVEDILHTLKECAKADDVRDVIEKLIQKSNDSISL